ncbi:MAG: ribosome maturation factor RimP [Acidobacteria bacterium]|nr:ribosome maturation factor RimP [Acidobacteriota bacterium]
MRDVRWLEKMRIRAEEAAKANGVELFDFEERLQGKRWWFRVTLDRIGAPVAIEDCERVSKDLSARLDVEDIVPHAYELEVSSPGLERPLRNKADFERFAGSRAKVVLAPLGEERGGALEGVIKGAVLENVVIEADGVERSIPFGRVKRAHLVFEFPKKNG